MSRRKRSGERSHAILLVLAAGVLCATVVAHGQPVSGRTAQVSQAVTDLPPGRGADVARERCTACHGAALIVQQRLTREGWSREIDKMVGWGAVVAEGDRETLLDYLSTTFGVRPSSAPGVAAAEGPVSSILTTRCQACHDMHLVQQQRLDATSWRREVDKMIGWGAVLNDAERDALIAHLAGRFP